MRKIPRNKDELLELMLILSGIGTALSISFIFAFFVYAIGRLIWNLGSVVLTIGGGH